MNKPPFHVLCVANHFLSLSHRDKKNIDHLKLQKLLYCAYGWYFFFHNKPLTMEFPEAWRYGPIFSRVFHELKRWGNEPIEEGAKRLVEGPFGDMYIADYILDTDSETLEFLEKVWKAYKDWTSLQLATTCHRAGGAWEETVKANPGRADSTIPDKLVIEEFKKRYSEEKDK